MTYLVTGATANIGRKVVDHLLGEGVAPGRVRALTARPERAALPAGVQVARGHIGRPDTLDGVFDGVTAMYLAPSEHAREALALARAAGVQHVVATDGPPESWWNDQREAVEDSGIAWTHLWPGEFMENYLMWAPQTTRGDVVRDAYPDAANAAVCMDDIAAIAARTMTEDGHRGQSYLLTGPETLTRRARVETIGAVLGRAIEYEEVSPQDAVGELAEGFGESAEWYVGLLPDQVAGPQPVEPAFAEVMGRPATSFADWVRSAAADF